MPKLPKLNTAGVGVVKTGASALISGIRTTSVAVFEQCPASWYHRTIMPLLNPDMPETQNKYAKIGTTVHSVIEAFLRGEVTNDPDVYRVLLYDAGATETEVENLQRYLDHLGELNPAETCLAIEQEWKFKVDFVGLPLHGHIDAVFGLGDTLLIVDHKTNRRYQNVEYWSNGNQPLMYAWAARKLWPQFKRVRFRIGYVNLGEDVEWETSKLDDVALEAKLTEVWTCMAGYFRQNFFPYHVNEGCCYCPMRNECPEFESALKTLRNSFVSAVQEQTPEERYVWITDVLKCGEAIRDQLKQEIVNNALEQSGGEDTFVQTPNAVLKVSRGKRRAVNFLDLNDLIAKLSVEVPSLPELLREYAENIFTVKVTGLDLMLKARPELAAWFKQVIYDKPNSEYTLSIKRVQAAAQLEPGPGSIPLTGPKGGTSD